MLRPPLRSLRAQVMILQILKWSEWTKERLPALMKDSIWRSSDGLWGKEALYRRIPAEKYRRTDRGRASALSFLTEWESKQRPCWPLSPQVTRWQRQSRDSGKRGRAGNTWTHTCKDKHLLYASCYQAKGTSPKNPVPSVSKMPKRKEGTEGRIQWAWI